MYRTINGRKYLMRDTRPVKELRELWKAFCKKYGQMDFHKWLGERGKVHIEIKKGSRS